MSETYEGTLNKKTVKDSSRGEFYLLTINDQVFFANKSVGEIPPVGAELSITFDTRGEDDKGRPYRWISGIQKTGGQETLAEQEPVEETKAAERKRESVDTYDTVMAQAILNAESVVRKSLMIKKAIDSADATYATLTSAQKDSITIKDLFDAYIDLYRRIGISLAIAYERNGKY